MLVNDYHCNDSSCCTKQNKTWSDRMQRSIRHGRYFVWTIVLWQCFIALLSTLLQCLWTTVLAVTSPVTLRSVTSTNESRMNESCVRMLCYVPVLVIACVNARKFWKDNKCIKHCPLNFLQRCPFRARWCNAQSAVQHGASSCGTRIGASFTELALLGTEVLVGTSPNLHCEWRRLLRRVTNTSSLMM